MPKFKTNGSVFGLAHGAEFESDLTEHVDAHVKSGWLSTVDYESVPTEPVQPVDATEPPPEAAEPAESDVEPVDEPVKAPRGKR